MENKRYSLRSLPGGRRGASGADAGCHSMRTVGDGGLSRRVPLDKSKTAEQSSSPLSSLISNIPSPSSSFKSPNSLSSTSSSTHSRYELRSLKGKRKELRNKSPSSTTLEDVAQTASQADNSVPTTSYQNKRMKWSRDINEFILRTYLQVTMLESDNKTYLEPLYNKFIEKYPDFQVSRQRLGDQRRAITRNKLIPDSRIAEIYSEVQSQLKSIHTLNPPTQIKASTPDQIQNTRMKWSTQHNETIIRSYLRVTHLETNLTSYRKQMHREFISCFPHLEHISEQRVADQRRIIINNRYISEDRLKQIRKEIAEELNIDITLHDHSNTNTSIVISKSHHTTHIPPQDNIPRSDSIIVSSNDEICENNATTLSEHSLIVPSTHIHSPVEQIQPYNILECNVTIDKIFNEALTQYTEVDPTNRPYIPKQRSSKNLAIAIKYINNIILPQKINSDTDFLKFQTLIYCAAITAAKFNGARIKNETSNSTGKDHRPGWQRRIEKRIEELRIKIGRLTQFIQGNRSRKIIRHTSKILDQYNVHATHEVANTQPLHVLDTLKQKLAVASHRLKRYKQCTLRKTQNSHFSCNEKQFYRSLNKSDSHLHQNVSPLIPEFHHYWANIWERPLEHNYDAHWLKEEELRYRDVPDMSFIKISAEIFNNVLSKLQNWKAPGSDNLHNYWYKKFSFVHSFLLDHINNFVAHPETVPNYITEGITHMLPKDHNELSNPAKYRPITCLQTIYKIITSCIAEEIYKHVNTHNILSEEQKGCRKLSQGCKEQLTIDSVILKQALKKKKDIFTMYIDYKKAYDSIPHSWLFKVLGVYKINPILVNFLRTISHNWATKLKIRTCDGYAHTTFIKIQRGIFQGDALSPLWFCLALNPLSNTLNSTNIGYPLNYIYNNESLQSTENSRLLTHLLYMDDIKLYAASQDDIDELAQVTEVFSDDVCMEFGIDKCKTNSIRAGQIHKHHYTLSTGEQIDPLDDNNAYKYLGFDQTRQILNKETKSKIIQQFKNRINLILKSQLNSRNIIKAINTFAIPVLTYSFGILQWSKTDLKNIQRNINVAMTKNRKHHPRSCLQRLTLPRVDGGRGLIDITNLHNKQITNLRQYFHNKALSSTLHNAIVYNDNKYTPLNLTDKATQPNELIIDRSTKLAAWAQKSLHGRHLQDLNNPNVDKTASNEWLRRGELFPETEGFILAIQDQVIETRNYQKHIIKSLTSDICRKCNSAPETIQHITGACKAIVQTDYKHRHDQVCYIIHQKLAKKYKLISDEPLQAYYKYTPETILENSTHKLYYDRTILTDKTVHYNRPDITLVDKNNKTALLIDIAIPNTHNVQNTISEKISKYTDLKDEITRMWKLQKVSIVPIVLSTTGIIPKNIHKSIEMLDLPPKIYLTLQKATLLNTCRIVRKFLSTDSNGQTHPEINV